MTFLTFTPFQKSACTAPTSSSSLKQKPFSCVAKHCLALQWSSSLPEHHNSEFSLLNWFVLWRSLWKWITGFGFVFFFVCLFYRSDHKFAMRICFAKIIGRIWLSLSSFNSSTQGCRPLVCSCPAHSSALSRAPVPSTELRLPLAGGQDSAHAIRMWLCTPLAQQHELLTAWSRVTFLTSPRLVDSKDPVQISVFMSYW